MINKDEGTMFRFYGGGGTAVMRGNIELMGVSPTRENPALSEAQPNWSIEVEN